SPPTTSRSSSSAGAVTVRLQALRRICGSFARDLLIIRGLFDASDVVARARMVSEQIRARGVDDHRVLDAMLRVPRHLFVDADHQAEAYEDHPVGIVFGQTIPQPYCVGFMPAALQLEPSHRVLEIGTGSGYQTALLAELTSAVYSLE